MASKRAQQILEKALEQDGDISDVAESVTESVAESSASSLAEATDDKGVNDGLTKDKVASLEEGKQEFTRNWVKTQAGIMESENNPPTATVPQSKPLVDYSPTAPSVSSHGVNTEHVTPKKASVMSVRQPLFIGKKKRSTQGVGKENSLTPRKKFISVNTYLRNITSNRRSVPPLNAKKGSTDQSAVLKPCHNIDNLPAPKSHPKTKSVGTSNKKQDLLVPTEASLDATELRDGQELLLSKEEDSVVSRPRLPSPDIFASDNETNDGEGVKATLSPPVILASTSQNNLSQRSRGSKSSEPIERRESKSEGATRNLRKRKPKKCDYVESDGEDNVLFSGGSDSDVWEPENMKRRHEVSDTSSNDSSPVRSNHSIIINSVKETNAENFQNDNGDDHHSDNEQPNEPDTENFQNDNDDGHNSDNQQPDEGKPNTRKARAERNKLRNIGQGYKGAKGQVVKPRTLRPLPICKAKWCQILQLSEEDRKAIFTEYWAFGDHSKRCQYVSSRVLKKDTKTTTKKAPAAPADPEDSEDPGDPADPADKTKKTKDRTCTLEYSLIHNEQRIVVSKQCFLATLGENDRFVRGIIERRSSTGQVPDDGRGKHSPSNKLPEAVKQEVIAHIRRFPAYVSHYSRRHTQQQYLGKHLNISIMHNLYLEEGGTKLSYSKYSEIFNSLSPSLKFKTPKLDTCTTCDSLENSIKAAQSPEEKQTLEQELQLHTNKADFAYACKREDKETAKTSKNTVSTIVFDLEQVLPCPYLTSGNVFYLRQLSVYNLTVFATETKEAYNFMWHEAIAGRGADEVASCLLSYFNYLPDSVKHVIMYSDTCSGQNKNSLMIAALLYTVQQHPTIDKIDQKFLVSGHTHLECDQAHHQIEKKKKTTNISLHHPQNYFDLVREIGPAGRKFKVKEMKCTDICSLERLLSGPGTPLVWRKTDSDGNKFLFSDAEWFRFEKSCPGIVKYKKSLHKEEPFISLNWKRKKNAPLPELEVYQKRNTPCPISAEKKKDLLSLLDQINPLYHDFYKNLPCDKNLADEDPDLPPEYNVTDELEGMAYFS